MKSTGYLFSGAVGLLVLMACQAAAPRPAPSRASATPEVAAPSFAAGAFESDVAFLASDDCQGRLTGTAGAARAADYIASSFRSAGLKPLAGLGDYYQPFEFNAGVRRIDGRVAMDVLESADAEVARACALDGEFRPLTFSGNGRAQGEVVFVGYGLVEPQAAAGTGYDSYAGLDVQDKIVLALRDLPEDIDPRRRQELGLYAGDRYKARLAGDRGARAFLLVVGPNSAQGGELLGFRENDRTSSVPIPAASISGELADRLLASSGTTLQALQSALDDGSPDPHASVFSGTHVRLEVELQRINKECRNVIGVLPPRGGSHEYVLIGGHYDHIGSGEGLGSLAREHERGHIHNGADDNASGTAMVLQLARALAAEASSSGKAQDGPRRGAVFACWSGEELGLVGSSHFVTQAPLALERIVAYLNFDMVGRLRDNRLIVQSVGSSPAWTALLERANKGVGFDLALKEDPYLPTDSTAFYTKGVPGLNFFTDLHEDYNRPSDDADTLEYDQMARIASLAWQVLGALSDPGFDVPHARVERAARAAGRGRMRAFTGIVPDYAAGDAPGVLLADVRPGGPADKAGLRGGDRVVEFAGSKITSLQDYADVLVGAKPGQTVTVVVMREGRRVELQITPETRGQ